MTTKKNVSKTTGGKTKRGSNKAQQGNNPSSVINVPTARERAKDMDNMRRGNAQTFEL